MSIILAADTTQAACSVALYKGAQIFTRLEVLSKGHAEIIAAQIEAVLVEAGVQAAQIDYLVATNGPGSFTGVRVGLSALAGLAVAIDKPLSLFGTLEAMALGVEEESEPIAVIVDARRDCFYCQFFKNKTTALTEPQALNAEQVMARAQELFEKQNAAFLLCGTGKEIFGAEKIFKKTPAPDYPQAANIICAVKDWDAAAWVAATPPPFTAAPLYLRPPDAKLPLKNNELRYA